MDFKIFRDLLQTNFNNMISDSSKLFEVALDKDQLWNTYLDSFPAGTNEIYRERREMDCSCCRQFIKSVGAAVVIKDNKIKTVWDFETESTTYQPVVEALSSFVKSHAVAEVFITKERKLGVDKNYEVTPDGKTKEWYHFLLELPKSLATDSYKSEAEIRGGYRDVRNVFKRSLDEITIDSVETVLELISQNSLYKGEEWKAALTEFHKLKKEYELLSTHEEKENYAWVKSVQVGGSIGKIRNHSIGTLLVNLSENMDLDEAVRKYEVIVAPSNYKRPKAIFTAKMLEDAKKTIQELGYLDSLERRHATLDDITVNNILFSNKDAAKRIKGGNVFDDMLSETVSSPKKFSKVEEVDVETFVKSVLPSANEVEVYLENKHSNNMVSLIAPKHGDSKSMFKWNNGFSWAYSGNITDSNMKERVKSAGGKVDGDLRFSIQWNDVDSDTNDLDAHCVEPNGYEIYYANRRTPSPTKGMLDVDIISPQYGVPSVENITWDSRNSMKNGTYKFFVHAFSGSNKSGFRAEIEFDGQVYSFDYNKPVRSGQRIEVAEVTLNNGIFTISEKINSNLTSREVWNLKTNQFVPVSTLCYSPNYWDEQNGIGHKHYFFMLKNCINPESPNGFYNEFLKEELMQHKRVFEALGGKMAVEVVDDQLSGIGFSSTKRNDLIVKVKGQTERVLKINF